MANKLQIAVFPWLAFGHIIPFLELAKAIAHKGHKIYFISTPRNIHRLPKLPQNLQPFVDLIELPLPRVENLPENAEATSDIPDHIIPYLKKAFDGLEEPFTKFLERSKPDWIIYDFAHYWLPPISSKLGIPCIFFTIFSAFGSSLCLDTFTGKTNKTPEQEAIFYVLSETNESGVSDMFRILETQNGAQAWAHRSCMEIEGEYLKFIESKSMKPVIPVGLLPPSLQFSEESKDHNWETILNWLDKQGKGSVIYVAFGSEVSLSDEDFTEIAMGLELSGFPYFWVLKKQNTSVIESEEWLQNESNRGMVWRTWAPQLRILSHKSVGGFLTHSGWSSVIEGLQVGCPLILSPFQNEQYFVAKFMEERKVGIKVQRNEHDGKFTRDSVAKALRTVMLEDEGKTLRSQAHEISKIIGDRELHQRYVDEFVHYMEIHRPAFKDWPLIKSEVQKCVN